MSVSLVAALHPATPLAFDRWPPRADTRMAAEAGRCGLPSGVVVYRPGGFSQRVNVVLVFSPEYSRPKHLQCQATESLFRVGAPLRVVTSCGRMSPCLPRDGGSFERPAPAPFFSA